MTVVGQILSAYAPNLEFNYFSYAVIGGWYSSMTFSVSRLISMCLSYVKYLFSSSLKSYYSMLHALNVICAFVETHISV